MLHIHFHFFAEKNFFLGKFCINFRVVNISIHAAQRFTEPEDAKRFYEATQVDCLAVSVGTVHRMTTQSITIQYDRLRRIQEQVSVPLVIHGATSVKDEDLIKLSLAGVRKINLGTCLRMTFGNTLRRVIEENPREFDRLKLFATPIEETLEAAEMLRAQGKIRWFGVSNFSAELLGDALAAASASAT